MRRYYKQVEKIFYGYFYPILLFGNKFYLLVRPIVDAHGA